MWAWSDADDDDKAAAPVNEDDIRLLLDLIECLMNYGRRFMTLYRRQGSRPSP